MAHSRQWSSQDLVDLVKATSDQILQKAGMKLANASSESSGQAKAASLEDVQREIRETTNFWQRARRFSDRFRRRHHTI